MTYPEHPDPATVARQVMEDLALARAAAASPFTAQDRDALLAAADLASRAGASGFHIGYNPDSTPVTWFAVAEYGPRELAAEGYPDPASAATALAVRILSGGKCRCGGLVALSVDGAWAPGDSATMLDGSDPAALRNAPQCLWILEGARWTPGCDAPPLPLTGAEIRRNLEAAASDE